MNNRVAEESIPGSNIVPPEDKRLDRLLEYTKFHIGIYLSIGGGLVTLISVASVPEQGKFLDGLIGAHWALAVALAFMAVAGLAGGIVASSCAQFETFTKVWNRKLGPHKLQLFTGETWAFIEHSAFWASIFALVYAVLSKKEVVAWLGRT